MTDREETQDAPVMDGATDAGVEEKKDGARDQRAADVAVHGEAATDGGEHDDAATDGAVQEDLQDDLRSIRGYGEDR
ncbi:hypothetical protein [Microbacterium sp.]|uniref:hypothetical protein n=1 Tax=Microbacterium sp. TaxID=51671 RepID=UPI0039187B09